MRMTWLLMSTAALALLLTGCASNYAAHLAESGNYTYQPTRSEALNVAVAVGLTRCNGGQCKPIDDAPRSKLPAAYRGESNANIAGEMIDALTLAQGVGQVAGVVNVASGLGSVAGGLMTIGSFFTAPVSRDNPATKSFIVAWMPQSLASAPKAARSRMQQIVWSALKNSAPEGYRAEPYSTTYQGPWDKLLGSDDLHWEAGLKLHGQPGCPGKYVCNIRANVNIPQTAKQTPSWLSNSGSSYVWPAWRFGSDWDDAKHYILLKTSHYNGGEYSTGLPEPIDRVAYLRRVSTHLPDWAYIYSPPTQKHPYPAMFNNGEILLFIEPLTTQANTEQAA